MADKKTQKPTTVDSRDALLSAAKRVFAQKGFEGATVKDLADEAGVNVSLVSYHFGGKENLYKSCLESFGTERLEAAERVLKAPATHEEFKLRIRLFAEDFLAVHVKQEDTCKMIHRGMDTMDAVTADVFMRVFLRIFDAFKSFLAASQEKGLIKKDLDVQITAPLMFGALMHVIRSQSIARMVNMPTIDDPVYAGKVIDHWIELTTTGIFVANTEGTRS